MATRTITTCDRCAREIGKTWEKYSAYIQDYRGEHVTGKRDLCKHCLPKVKAVILGEDPSD